MSQAAHDTIFEANPTQAAFITSHREADLFACRMGEGKSTALVWCPFQHTMYNPGAVWAMIRDTWENLRDTTLQEFFKWFPPGIYGDWSASTKTWTWNCEGVEGSIMWMGMDDPKDAAKLQSRSLAGFCIDEPAPAAESGGVSETIFDVALTRLRQPGMKWYGAKLAENNPDESHWTYRRFVEPGFKGDPDAELPTEQTAGFGFFQTATPENVQNLPAGYYQRMQANLERAGRPDLASRFAKGDFGFQQPGKAVTPEFNKAIHVRRGLLPLDTEVRCCWDFGLNPTCILTQLTPMSNWHVLEAYVGDGIGTYQLINEVVKSRLHERFKGLALSHYGDPQGKQRDQSNSDQTAVRVIKKELGGRWYPGPREWIERRDAVREVLKQLRNGTGLVQIDEQLAKPLWHALRGGWHYQIHAQGTVSHLPKKDIHSHPGDAFAYAAAVLFPAGSLKAPRNALGIATPSGPSFWGNSRRRGDWDDPPPFRVPAHGEPMATEPRLATDASIRDRLRF